MSSADQKTVPVGVVSELIRGDIFFWGQLMAGALLGSVPVALVYSSSSSTTSPASPDR